MSVLKNRLQAKIYLWLECDQYVHNYSILSAEDTCCHALQIAKKFFNEGTTFSVVDQVSESIKQKIEYLVRAIGDSFSSGKNLTILISFDHTNCICRISPRWSPKPANR